MKMHGIAFIGVALSGLALGQPQTVETKPLETAGVAHLEVRTFNGFVRVVAGAESPGVTVTRRGQVSYTVGRSGDALVLEGKKRVTLCVNCMVAFEVRVPAGLAVRIATSNGAVEVRGGVRGLEATTSNGHILARDTGTADLTLKTSNGRVEVQGASGQVRVDTSNGSVLLERVTFRPGSTNWVRTSNGAVTVRASGFPQAVEIEGRTSNGRVSFGLSGFEVRIERSSFEAKREGERGSEARLELSTSNGAVSVE